MIIAETQFKKSFISDEVKGLADAFVLALLTAGDKLILLAILLLKKAAGLSPEEFKGAV